MTVRLAYWPLVFQTLFYDPFFRLIILLCNPTKVTHFVLKPCTAKGECECRTKAKGVTTQMKALGEYFLMVVFMLWPNRVHVLAIIMFNLVRETWQ